MKHPAIAGAIALAFVVAGCTEQQKCFAGKSAYIAFKASGRGGEAEKQAAEKAYSELRERCLAAGIIL